MTNEAENPAEMASEELRELLSSLKVELEDLEQERMFVLGQTGLHVSAGAVKNFESQLGTLRDRIAEAKRLLQDKQE